MISFDGNDSLIGGGDFGGLDDFEAIEQARILVVGCGGCGNNIVAAITANPLPGVSTMAVNTDAQHLKSIAADYRVLIGRKACRGLGAGNQPQRGEAAARESIDLIRPIIDQFDMVVTVAGLGGGTGTGSAPVVAEAARAAGKLTLSIATTPFQHEFGVRANNAERGLALVTHHSDALVVIPNERLLMYGDHSIAECQSYIDRVLLDATSTISNIINVTGLQNVDFADVTRVLRNGGRTLFGVGRAEGPGAGVQAAQLAAQSPLLDGVSIDRAARILVNCTFDVRATKMDEWQETLRVFEGFSGDSREIIVGQVDRPGSTEFEVAIIASHIEPHPNPIEFDVLDEEDSEFLTGPTRAQTLREVTPTPAPARVNTDRMAAVGGGFATVLDAPSEMEGYSHQYGSGRHRVQSGSHPAFLRRTAAHHGDNDR